MDSDGNKPKPMQMAALGRPFSLGMLYDSRSDKLVPGITLWDKEKLNREDLSVFAQPNTEFSIVASESISDKSSSLGVEASLKTSFLGGMISVEGSAKYLKNSKSSSKQARVTLQYKTTTEFIQLNMDQLATGNIEHSEVIDKDLATHVVTGILYGAQAFFVFDQQVSEGESAQDIHANLKTMVNIIPSFKIEAGGDVQMEDAVREKVSKFSCTFHGDFHLEKSPTTFEEAVKVYQDLPTLLGPNKENVLPVTVYLLPLSVLDSKASKLVRQISLRLVTEAENILEGFTEVDMWCNDVLNSPTGQNFSQISKKIKTFKALCSEFKLGFQGTLAQILPSIRGGGEEESVLAEVLVEVAKSPFSSYKLNEWMEDKDEEVNTIKTLMKLIKNTETVSSKNTLINKVSDSEKALVFVLTSLDSTEPFLSELDEYLKEPQSNRSDAPKSKQWYNSEDVLSSVRQKVKLFSDFAEANEDRDKQSIQFLAIGLANENHEGSTIYLYEDGFKTSENFEFPSEPEAVTVGDVTESTVRLTFSAPSEGEQSVTGYRVEFCEKGQEEWKLQPQAEAGEVTVTGLSPDTEYSIRVRAITAVGLGPAASLTVTTKEFSDAVDMGPGLLQEIQQILESDGSKEDMSEVLCSALVYTLQVTGTVLEKLDVRSLKTSDEGKQRLVPAVRNCIIAYFVRCGLSAVHCTEVASALSSSSSHLRELALGFNDLGDSGVSELCAGLKTPQCQLSYLGLWNCGLSEISCSSLASALKSNPSHLTDLELSGNDLSESDVKELLDLKQSPDFALENLLWKY